MGLRSKLYAFGSLPVALLCFNIFLTLTVKHSSPKLGAMNFPTKKGLNINWQVFWITCCAGSCTELACRASASVELKSLHPCPLGTQATLPATFPLFSFPLVMGSNFHKLVLTNSLLCLEEKKLPSRFSGKLWHGGSETAGFQGPDSGQMWSWAQNSRGEHIQREGTEIHLLPLGFFHFVFYF